VGDHVILAIRPPIEGLHLFSEFYCVFFNEITMISAEKHKFFKTFKDFS